MVDATDARRLFPGGRARLPRLDQEAPAEPAFSIVGTAFVRDDPESAEPSGFTGYFTYESLFNAPEEPEHVEAVNGPYEVLGVTASTPWAEVTARHRALVKEFHPDRLVGASAVERAEAEDRIRVINVAFTELRKLHPGGH